MAARSANCSANCSANRSTARSAASSGASSATHSSGRSSTRTAARSSTRTATHNSLRYGSRTDTGCVRDHNEDSLLVEAPLFAIADGMGGHSAGEVASEIAISTLADIAPRTTDSAALSRAVCAANLAIIEGARIGIGREDMGCTLTAAILEGERLVIAQVGDSRAYLLHRGRLQPLTRDHSFMAMMIESGQLTPEEARYHPQRSMVTRSLGSDPDTQPDLYELNVEAGDRLLLCSDGLTTMLEDDEIATILKGVSDPQRCATTLVSEANRAGGYDNTTVIVTDVAGSGAARAVKQARCSTFWLIAALVALVAVVCGAYFGLRAYASTTAYLVEEDGMVAVYQGVPGSVLGLQCNELDSITDFSVTVLPAGVASRLSNGISVDNLEAAYALVEEYRNEINDDSAVSDGVGSGSN